MSCLTAIPAIVLLFAIPAEDSVTVVDEKLLALVDAGMPDPAREWFGEDYGDAVRAISALMQEDDAFLPELNQPPLDVVFRKFAEVDRDYYTDRSEAVELRFTFCIRQLEANSRLMGLCIQAMIAGHDVGTELTLLGGSQFELVAVQVRLVEEIVPTLDPNASDHAVRMSGLDDIRGGIGLMYAGLLQTVAESDRYADDDIKTFVQRAAAVTPTLTRTMRPLARRELTRRIDELKADDSLTFLIDELSKLQQAISDGAKRKSPNADVWGNR